MAPRLNKRKTLEAATKHAQRGAFDKALKEYQKLLKVDPHDSHVRLRIGDLFLRRKQPDLAVEAYEQAAGQLVQKGFDAKAAAIYKQVLRIKPEHVEAHARLGEVHQRQGLAADALREFETAAELYRKRGAKHEAFELLRRVASLDPQNFANRLGLADLLFREGLTEEASEECHALLRDVQADDEPEELVRIAEQMLTHLPEDPQVVSAFSAGKVRCGAAGEGVAQLTSLAAEHPESVSVREALIECHEALGARAEVQALWRDIAELYKQRGDTDRAREILQRHVSLDPLDEEEQTPPSIDLLEEVVDTHENLGLDSRAAEPLDVSTVSEIELDHEAVETGDVGDLLAEARVALEFGDLEDAERRARAVLELDPTLDDARGVLAEACARLGRLDEAIELTTQRRDLAASAGDGDHLSQIEAKLLEYQNQQSARVETPTGLPDIEIELVSDGDRDSRAASVDPPPELREAVRRPRRKKPAPDRPTDPTGRSPDAAEDLSEAQFFVEQGLLDEAERILEGVLEKAPDHPIARTRLGEIEAARDKTPGRIGSSKRRAKKARAPIEVDLDLESEVEIDLTADSESSPPDDLGINIEIEVDEEPSPRSDLARPVRLDPGRDPEEVPAEIESPTTGEAVAFQLDLDDEEQEAPSEFEPGTGAEDDPFDLAAELELTDDDPTDFGASAPGMDAGSGPGASGFQQVFSAFKSAIEEQVGEEEYQAHYDLGIAYREMGLLEDAIREFEQASKGQALCVEALNLVGSCKVAAGRSGEAIRDFDRALGMAEEGSDAHLALRYERANALAAGEKRDEALEEFRRVQEASPDYREVDERIAELEE